MMTHLIRQQYLHVDLAGSESDGLALQRTLPVLCRNWITPAIEAALDRWAPPDRHLCIEQLEIDVGTLTMEELDRKLAGTVAQALEKALREQVALARGPVQTAGVAVRSPDDVVHDAFIHFLKTGTLPWSFSLPAGKSLEQVLLESWGEQRATRPARLVAADVPDLLASAFVRERLIRQFSPLFLHILLSLLSQPALQWMTESFNKLRTLPLPADIFAEIERVLWDRALTVAATGEIVAAREVVAGKLRELGVELPEECWLELLRLWPETAGGTGSGMARGDMAGDGGADPAPRRSRQPSRQEYPPLGLYIDNAGCVLLHPFLPRFFEALRIAEGEKLLQPERALCLLHFLVTGRGVAPEYEAMLLKILCGIDLDAPVEADVALTDTEQQEADELLRAVIGHWQALKGTSPDGLRGSFLLRAGKVSQRPDGDWLLQVESQSCDILLEELPWGISVVKLPWMDRMLWVEWG